MEPQVWIGLAIQAVGSAVMVGVFLQQHKEYARRILLLEQQKLDTRIHELEVRRLDRDVSEVTDRVHEIERHGLRPNSRGIHP